MSTRRIPFRLSSRGHALDRALVRELPGNAPTPSAEALLHKLQRHQIELAMQNEELRRTQLALEESRDRYFDLYESAPIGYLALSRDATIESINPTGATLLGEVRANLLSQSFASFITPDELDSWHQLMLQAQKHKAPQSHELGLRRRDGTHFHARLDCVHPGGDAGTLRVTLADISERKRMESELRVAATALDARVGIVVTDTQGVILKVNRTLLEDTGYSAEQVLGQTPRLFKSGRHDADFYRAMRESLERDGVWQGEIWDRRQNGDIYPKWMTITAVKDDRGRTSHYVSTHTDISARKAEEEEIKYFAFYDHLTRLPNRRLLLERLHQSLATCARTKLKGALYFIDLDHFKDLNDTHGHDQGDMLLQAVAQRLTASVRDCDTVARLGGDEFVVLVNNLSGTAHEAASQAAGVGEKMLAALSQRYLLAGHEYYSTPSIGVTLFDGQNESSDEILKQADLAMYAAKTAGRNGLRFFEPAMRVESERRDHAKRTDRMAAPLAAVQEKSRRLPSAIDERTLSSFAALTQKLGESSRGQQTAPPAGVDALFAAPRPLPEDPTVGSHPISTDLRPQILDYGSLRGAIEECADHVRRQTSITISVDTTQFRIRPPEALECLLFRIAYGALLNCARHSGASTVCIALASEASHVLLSIADDGVGFDPEVILHSGQYPAHGLTAMRERTELAEGTFRLESSQGRGTWIEVRVPTCGSRHGVARPAGPPGDL